MLMKKQMRHPPFLCAVKQKDGRKNFTEEIWLPVTN